MNNNFEMHAYIMLWFKFFSGFKFFKPEGDNNQTGLKIFEPKKPCNKNE